MAQAKKTPSISRVRVGTKKSRAAFPAKRKELAKNPLKTERLEARIHKDLKELISQAASVQGQNETEFVTSAIREAAQKALLDARLLQLSIADQKLFAEMLVNPPIPNAALKRAFSHHKNLIEN